jgi:hypothetical protein
MKLLLIIVTVPICVSCHATRPHTEDESTIGSSYTRFTSSLYSEEILLSKDQPFDDSRRYRLLSIWPDRTVVIWSLNAGKLLQSDNEGIFHAPDGRLCGISVKDADFGAKRVVIVRSWCESRWETTEQKPRH